MYTLRLIVFHFSIYLDSISNIAISNLCNGKHFCGLCSGNHQYKESVRQRFLAKKKILYFF